MKYLNFSEIESKKFGLRIARSGRIENFDPKELLQEIQKEKIDIARIKLQMSNENIYRKIDDLRMFYSHLYFVTFQKHDLKKIESPEPALHFELFTGEKKEELNKILDEIVITPNGIYYRSELYDHFFKRTNSATSYDYYLSMNNAIDKNKFLFIGRNHTGEAVGVCSFLKTNNEEAEGVIYGVRPKFRGQNFAQAFLKFSLKTLKDAGVKTFFTEAQYFNVQSLSPHMRVGFQPAGLYLNLLLYPLLSAKKDASFEIKTGERFFTDIKRKLREISKKNFSIIEMKGEVEQFFQANENVKISLPVLAENFALAAVFSKRGTGYMMFEKSEEF